MKYLWNHKLVLFLTVFVLIFAFTLSANAFDKRRKGFILGIGLGPGYNSRTVTINSNELMDDDVTQMALSDISSNTIVLDTALASTFSDLSVEESFSKFAFTTNFKIGYAFSDKFMVYWNNSVSWFSNTEDSIYIDSVVSTDISGADSTYYKYIHLNKSKDKKSLAIGVGGIGATYFLQPKAPSLFFNLGVGFSTQSYPFKGTDPDVGLGINGGIGYEFSPNWSLELVFLYAQPNGDTDARPVTYETNSMSVGLVMNVLGY
ncbi:MAG: hypothetical protein ABIJ45_11150 [Candidatus Zixiibacteriota bacterium]